MSQEGGGQAREGGGPALFPEGEGGGPAQFPEGQGCDPAREGCGPAQFLEGGSLKGLGSADLSQHVSSAAEG